MEPCPKSLIEVLRNTLKRRYGLWPTQYTQTITPFLLFVIEVSQVSITRTYNASRFPLKSSAKIRQFCEVAKFIFWQQKKSLRRNDRRRLIWDMFFLEYVGMGASVEHQQYELCVILLPHQQPIGLDMALPSVIAREVL